MTEVHFLPWMRTGLAARIPAGAGGSGQASVTPTVDLYVDGQRADTVPGPQVILSGPGDVLSLDGTEIKRRTPEPGATDVEANYFASVEFHSPDLPWRYSPTGVDARGRLTPWLALVVVELGPGVTLAYGGRLPTLTVEYPDAELPDPDEAWAWAHVQVSTSLAPGLAAAYASDPAAFSSRLLCPRRLRPGVRYTACIVPIYDAGARTGLGEASHPSLNLAWGSARAELPVYDTWEFTVGEAGDFKTLVRLIKPRKLDPEVGSRDLDVTRPGGGLPGIRSPLTWFGAMHAPNERRDYWPTQADRIRFTRAARSLLNERDTGKTPQAYDPLVHDPVVGPPVYGSPQVGQTTVPAASQQPYWFGELSTEPQHRTVAGLGAEVVRADQEVLMAAAWEQARPAVEANRILNRGRLAQEAALSAEAKLAVLSDALAVQLAGPALRSMRVQGTSAWARVRDGDAPTTYFEATFRRLGRPGGPLSAPGPVPAARSPAWSITQAVLEASSADAAEDAGSLCTGYRTRYVPAGMDVGVDLMSWTPTSSGPGGGVGSGTINVKIIDRTVAVAPPGRGGATGVTGRARMEARTGAAKASDLGSRLDRTGGARRLAPPSMTLSGAVREAKRLLDEPSLWKTATRAIPQDGTVSTVELMDYRFELVRPAELGRVMTVDGSEGELGVALADVVRDAVRPARAILDSVRARVVAPAGALADVSVPTRIGVQPRFVDPMYERLRALSVEYLVPGIGMVPENTLGLMEVNPAFVEAFLVGLNHELSREFRWREYPTRLDQTWFQHFWDTVDPEEVDVLPIDRWRGSSHLGEIHGEGEEPMLVLLLKGELIRRYPDVRIYAFPAIWDGGNRQPEPGGEALAPRFVGALQPGVNFYGFDLVEEDARGDGGGPGWFFVLEEEQRAMRFGLDTGLARDKEEVPATWTDLSWANLAAEGEPKPEFCAVDTVPWIEAAVLGGNGGTDAWGDDAAAMARITFRRPVQVFMHASAMLPEPGGGSGG